MPKTKRRLDFEKATEAELAQLPDKSQALILKLWCSQPDLTYEQLALELNIPIGTVRSRLHRARARVSKNRRAEVASAELRRAMEAV